MWLCSLVDWQRRKADVESFDTLLLHDKQAIVHHDPLLCLLFVHRQSVWVLDDERWLEIKLGWLAGRPRGSQHHTTFTEGCAVQCAAASGLLVPCDQERVGEVQAACMKPAHVVQTHCR